MVTTRDTLLWSLSCVQALSVWTSSRRTSSRMRICCVSDRFCQSVPRTNRGLCHVLPLRQHTADTKPQHLAQPQAATPVSLQHSAQHKHRETSMTARGFQEWILRTHKRSFVLVPSLRPVRRRRTYRTLSARCWCASFSVTWTWPCGTPLVPFTRPCGDTTDYQLPFSFASSFSHRGRLSLSTFPVDISIHFSSARLLCEPASGIPGLRTSTLRDVRRIL